MAEYKGSNATNIAAGKKIWGGEISGRVKVLHEKITLTGDLAVNDTILGPKLPANAMVVDAYVRIPATLGATGIVSLGHGATVDASGAAITLDADAFVAAADGGGAASMTRISTEAGLLKRFYAETDIFATCTEVTASGTGKVIEFVVMFVID